MQKIGHRITDCGAEKPECPHSKGEHSAANKEYQRYQKEELLIEIQDREKVSLMRARQILENNNEYTSQPSKKYSTHFDCSMEEATKRTFTPWLLEKCLTNYLGSKPKAIRTLNKITCTIEVDNDRQSQEMKKLSVLNGIQVKVEVNYTLSASRV